jgi:ketosteroid isomerase-like protein
MTSLIEEADPMGVEENTAVVKKYLEAINRRDVDSFVSIFSDEAEWLDPVGTPANVGLAQIRRGFEGLCQAFASLTLTARNIVAQGDFVVSEQSVDVASAEGKRAHIEAADIFEIRDGKIKSCHAYFDPGWLNRQLTG